MKINRSPYGIPVLTLILVMLIAGCGTKETSLKRFDGGELKCTLALAKGTPLLVSSPSLSKLTNGSLMLWHSNAVADFPNRFEENVIKQITRAALSSDVYVKANGKVDKLTCNVKDYETRISVGWRTQGGTRSVFAQVRCPVTRTFIESLSTSETVIIEWPGFAKAPQGSTGEYLKSWQTPVRGSTFSECFSLMASG